MRRFYTFIVLSLFSVVAMAQLLPDNWTVNSSGLTVTQESTVVNDGSYSLNAVWTSTSNQDFDSDFFDVTGDAPFTYTLDVYDNDAGGRVRMAIIWSTGNDYQNIYSIDQDSWQTLTYSGNVPTGATNAKIRVRFYDVGAGWDGDASVYIDNAIYSEDGGTTNLITNASFEDWSLPVVTEYTIAEIQGEASSSPHEGETVQTNGIVTAVAPNGYFIQDGAGAWNGLFVFDNTNVPEVGDSLTLIGMVNEHYGNTQLGGAITYTLNNSVNALPNAVLLTSDGINEEMYEGVLVVINDVVCSNPGLGNGEWEVSDESGAAIIDDLMYEHIPVIYDKYNIVGVIMYSYGDYKLEPRDDTDIEYLGSLIDDALLDAAENISLEVTPETQTILLEETAELDVVIVYPATIDALLSEYYMDAVISFGEVLTSDVVLNLTYSQNENTPINLGPYTVLAGTNEAYVSEILGVPRVLLSEYVGTTLNWGIAVDGLVEGTYNVGFSVVTNTLAEFGTDDYELASGDAEIIVASEILIISQPENTTICVDDEAEFTIEAEGDEPLVYAWYYNDDLIAGEETETIFATEVGEYYCVISNDDDSKQSETWTLSISIPQVVLGEDATYCLGFEIVIDAGDFETYSWNTEEDTQTISPDTSGTFVVEVEDIYGCSATDEIVITFDSEWSFDLPNTTALCENTEIVIEMPDADAWAWSTGEVTQSITIDTAGMYSVTVTQGSCVIEDSTEVELEDNPLPIELGDTIYLCNGDNIEIESPIYSYGYLWNTGETTREIEITEEGLYTLTIFNVSGCFSSDDVYVQFNDYMVVLLEDTIKSCEGLEIYLDPGMVDSLIWGDGTHVDSLLVTTTGLYYVTIVDDLGCEGEDSTYVIFNELPVFELGNDTAFCNGNSTVFSAPDAELWEWNNGETTQDIEVSTANAYTVTITDENGCQNYSSRILTVWDNPFVDLGPDKTITEDQTIILGTEPGHVDYAWSTGATEDFIVINGEEMGVGEHLISVTVISSDACTSYDEVLITIIEGVGIATNLTQQVRIYPNPASTNVSISIGRVDNFVSLQIISIEGKILAEDTQEKELYSFDINSWSAGMYFVRITTQNQTASIKLVVE